MARLSPRSIVATCAFVAVGFITVYLLRHAGG
jgi:preprotein translocase subunit Sec61beta